MSAILNFISRLSPRIRKADVLSDIETTIKELRECAIPMAAEMSNQARITPFKSKFSDVFSSQIYDKVKFEKKSKNVWLDLSNALSLVLVNAEAVQKLCVELLQEDTLRDGITARGAHLLRTAGALSFISRYITEVADYTLSQEAMVFGDEDTSPPAQSKYVTGNVEKFARLLADNAIPTGEFNKLMADIPDIYLSDKTQSTVTAMFTPKQIDPFNNMSGMSNWISSPVYVARMMWETYQAERFHAAKDRKAMLELRLIHLQNKQHNDNNPRLQKEIEGLQARITKYDQKIRKVEESIV